MNAALTIGVLMRKAPSKCFEISTKDVIGLFGFTLPSTSKMESFGMGLGLVFMDICVIGFIFPYPSNLRVNAKLQALDIIAVTFHHIVLKDKIEYSYNVNLDIDAYSFRSFINVLAIIEIVVLEVRQNRAGILIAFCALFSCAP